MKIMDTHKVLNLSDVDTYPKWFNAKDLQTNPAGRSNVERLSIKQKDAFIELICRSECERTPQNLWDAGIVRPDWSFRRFMRRWLKIKTAHKVFYLSDAFLQKWLTVGYISTSDLPTEDISRPICKNGEKLMYYERNLSCAHHIYDYRNFINMSCAIVKDSCCFLWGCYLPYATFNDVDFYKAIIKNCILKGATAYGSDFQDCNDYRDADWHVLRHLVGCGMTGIHLEDLHSDSEINLNDTTDSDSDDLGRSANIHCKDELKVVSPTNELKVVSPTTKV